MSRRRGSAKIPNSDEAEVHNRQWVLITHESNLAIKPDEDCRPILCRLRHPKTGNAAVYMFADGGCKVLEVMSFNEGCRSWFIGNYVQSDGTMLVTTPIDPLFLALPYLLKASESGKFSPLDCVLDDSDFPECKRLTMCISTDELSNIAATKGSDGLYVFKYDSDKTLLWLKLKVESLVSALQRQKVNVSGSSSVSTYVKSRKSAIDVNEEDYIRYACGVIADYLQPDLAKQLREYLGVKPNAENDASEKYSGHSPVKKKAKVDSLTPLEDYSSNGILTASKKAEAAADSYYYTNTLVLKQEDDRDILETNFGRLTRNYVAPQKNAKINVGPSESRFYSEIVLWAQIQQEKLTTAQKALSKVDKKGMKSISSFFSAPAKK